MLLVSSTNVRHANNKTGQSPTSFPLCFQGVELPGNYTLPKVGLNLCFIARFNLSLNVEYLKIDGVCLSSIPRPFSVVFGFSRKRPPPKFRWTTKRSIRTRAHASPRPIIIFWPWTCSTVWRVSHLDSPWMRKIKHRSPKPPSRWTSIGILYSILATIRRVSKVWKSDRLERSFSCYP